MLVDYLEQMLNTVVKWRCVPRCMLYNWHSYVNDLHRVPTDLEKLRECWGKVGIFREKWHVDYAMCVQALSVAIAYWCKFVLAICLSVTNKRLWKGFGVGENESTKKYIETYLLCLKRGISSVMVGEPGEFHFFILNGNPSASLGFLHSNSSF